MTSYPQGKRLLSVLQQFRHRDHWGFVIGITLLGVFLSVSARAAVFTVNSPFDVSDANPGDGVCETAPGNGVCTLRAAIEETNFVVGDDTIILPPNTYLLTQVAELTIFRFGNLTITGGGPSTTIIDGNKTVRPASGVLVMFVPGMTVNISGVTIRNGGSTSYAGVGGGINNSGTLALVNSMVRGNSATSGGGIENSGTLTLTNSTVSGNSAGPGAGGGIENSGTLILNNSTVSENSASGGGGISSGRGTLTLINSTVSGNSGGLGSGGGIGIGGGGTLTLINSTVSGNSSGRGGGIINGSGTTLTLINSTVSGNNSGSSGGGIHHNAGILTVTNSTVSGNRANGDGGGIYNAVHSDTPNFFNSTITNNLANADSTGNESGGGVFNVGPATINFQNSIIAGNLRTFGGVNVASDCDGTINSNGFNLIGTATLCTVTGGGVTVADPLLGPLQDNGGPTQTHALLPGSPAIDAGNPNGCRDNLGAPLTTDQRGFPRPADGNNDNVAACDMGAYESFITGSTSLVAAVLPGSRSVNVGVAAAAFATVINTGQAIATGCSIAPFTSLPASFIYQTTDPATNQVTGLPNTPANIAAGAAQSFVFAITPTAPIASTDVQFSFDCADTDPAPINVGLNTLLLSASDTPVPDIVALAVTLSNDGIVNIPGTNGAGAFAVATVNVGAAGSITVSADTGNAALPVVISLCETNPPTGQCISTIGPTVMTTISSNATPTFGIFVQATGNVPFDPAVNRVFVRFKDGGGVTRGSTSVAVRIQ